MDTDLPLEAEALTNHMGGLVEYLGKISSALPLDHDRGNDDAQILEGDAVDHIVQGRLHFQAVVLLLEACLEFAADRVGALPRYGTHCSDQAMPGAQSVHHQIQGFRQPLLKLVQALAAFMARPEIRQGACQRPYRDRKST